MRRLLPVLLICALAPLAAACGAEDDVKSAVDPVAQAATKTQNAGTVEVAMTGKVSAAGQEIPLNGEGAFDLKGKRGHLTLTTSVPGQGDVEVEEIIDGLVLYMRSDALSQGLPGAKKWLKIDLKEAGKKTGVDLAQLQQLSGGSSDPTQFLSYLSKAGDVEKVGTEDVNGTSTTLNHATTSSPDRPARPPTRCASSRRSPASRSCRPTSGSTTTSMSAARPWRSPSSSRWRPSST